MKILMHSISVLAHFEENGTPNPLRMTLADREYKIKQVTSVTENKLASRQQATVFPLPE